jgi:hypothetical protein
MQRVSTKIESFSTFMVSLRESDWPAIEILILSDKGSLENGSNVEGTMVIGHQLPGSFSDGLKICRGKRHPMGTAGRLD